jgi:hypothetical protein
MSSTRSDYRLIVRTVASLLNPTDSALGSNRMDKNTHVESVQKPRVVDAHNLAPTGNTPSLPFSTSRRFRWPYASKLRFDYVTGDEFLFGFRLCKMEVLEILNGGPFTPEQWKEILKKYASNTPVSPAGVPTPPLPADEMAGWAEWQNTNFPSKSGAQSRAVVGAAMHQFAKNCCLWGWLITFGVAIIITTTEQTPDGPAYRTGVVTSITCVDGKCIITMRVTPADVNPGGEYQDFNLEIATPNTNPPTGAPTGTMTPSSGGEGFAVSVPGALIDSP